jgi:NAD+ kinase
VGTLQIKENVSKKFDWYICSEYVRAMETAALLDLDNAHWHTGTAPRAHPHTPAPRNATHHDCTPDFFLRERDRGILSNLSRSEVRTRHQEELAREELDPFYHAPPGYPVSPPLQHAADPTQCRWVAIVDGLYCLLTITWCRSGESIASVCMRVARVVSHLRQTCSGYKVLLVCHGNIMWGFRITLEKYVSPAQTSSLAEPASCWYSLHPPPPPVPTHTSIKQAEFLRMIQDPQEKIHNCQIVHYSRRNPFNGIVESDINWMRSICTPAYSSLEHTTRRHGTTKL